MSSYFVSKYNLIASHIRFLGFAISSLPDRLATSTAVLFRVRLPVISSVADLVS